jgi:hydrogenase nickel incorporation protein HypA/HybF
MHELPVINKILNIALKHVQKNHVQKVVAIHLQIGEMSDLEDKWMQQYFDYLAKETIAAGARLKIKRIPVMMKCSDCRASYTVKIREKASLACTECGSSNGTMVSGREYSMTNMEVI